MWNFIKRHKILLSGATLLMIVALLGIQITPAQTLKTSHAVSIGSGQKYEVTINIETGEYYFYHQIEEMYEELLDEIIKTRTEASASGSTSSAPAAKPAASTPPPAPKTP